VRLATCGLCSRRRKLPHVCFLAVSAGVLKVRLDTKAPNKFSYIFATAETMSAMCRATNRVMHEGKLWCEVLQPQLDGLYPPGQVQQTARFNTTRCVSRGPWRRCRIVMVIVVAK